MKKLLVLLMTLVMCLAVFASCKKDETPNNGKNPGQTGDGTLSDSGNTIWTSGTDIVVVMNSELADVDTKIFNPIELSDALFIATGRIPTFYSDDKVPDKVGNELIIGNSGRKISKYAYDRLNDKLYGSGKDDESGWLIYASDGSLAIAYDCELSMRDAIAYLFDNLLTNNNLVLKNGIVSYDTFDYRDRVGLLRETERQEAFKLAGEQLNAVLASNIEDEKERNDLVRNTILALQDLYTLYTDDIYIWMSDLYDPEIGGFYYSNSGRNNLGFLPDVESTAQLLSFLNSSGLFKDAGGWVSAFSDEMKQSILNFVRNLQSPDDGYFYHPQWGKDIISARRGRDLGWATSLIKQLGAKPYYDAPDGTLAEKKEGDQPAEQKLTASFKTPISASVSKLTSFIKATSSSLLPDYLQSLDAWKEYIIELDISHYSYSAGNTLAAQHGQISLAGPEYEDMLINYLNETQLDNGMWEPQVDYNSVNGLMKLISSYNYYEKAFPRAEEALRSTIEVAINPDGHTHVCSIYNPWVVMALVIKLAEDYEGEDRANELRAYILPYMPELVRVTYQKLQAHIVKGGFHYHKDLLSNTSQAAPVGCAEEFEADVNATAICSTGITGNIFDVLGIDYVNLYYREDYNLFMKELDNLEDVIKNTPKPVFPETFDRFNISDAAYNYGMITYPANNAEISVPDKTMTEDGSYYKYYRSNVLDDPLASKPGDKALNLKNIVYDTPSGSKEYADSMYSANFDITNGYVMGSTYILDTDILVEYSDSNTAAQLFLMSTSNGLSLNLTVYEENGQQFIRLWENFVGADGYKDNNIVDGIPVGKWFNLRIELYKIYATEEGATARNLDVIAKIFINSHFVGTCDAFYTLKSDPSVFADNAVTLFKFALYRSCNSSIWLDNVKVEKSQQTYEYQQVGVAPEDIPNNLPEPDGTPAGGVYYNSITSLGKKYDFNALVKAPGLTYGEHAKTFIHSVTNIKDEVNSMIYFWKTDSGENAKDEATTHTFAAPTVYPDNMTVISEFDFALGGLGADTANAFRVVLNGAGYSASVYMSTDANGNIKFENVVGNSAYTTPMTQNKWYNIRFEAYLLSEISMNVKVYINGEYALDVKASNFKASSSSNTQIQWQAKAPDTAWVLYDNLFTGYDTKEYVYPDGLNPSDEPEFELPYGTHGGGVLYNDNKNIGKRYDFSDRNQLQIMLNSSGKDSTASTLLVDGAVLYQRTDTLTNDNVYYQVATADDTLTVAEFDIAFSNFRGDNAGYIRLYTGKTLSRCYLFDVSLQNGEIRFGNANDTSYVHEADSYESITENKWYNLRFELYVTQDGSGVAKIYINGEYAYTVKGILESRTNQARVMFQLYRPYSDSSIMVDNIYMGTHGKDYTIGETGEPEPPVVYPETDVTLGGTHEGGAVYNSNATGTRLNFNNAADPLPIPSNTSDIKVHRNDGGFIVLEQSGKTSGYITINFPNAPTVDEMHRVVNVVEFDALLSGVDGLAANTLIAKILLYSQDGYRTSAYFTYNKETGKIEFPKPNRGITEGELITIDPTVWNNFRFEYRVSGGKIVSDLYINGEFGATFLGEDNGSASSNIVRISFHNGAPEGGVWYALDNIYTGFKTEEIPTTPRIDSPEGITGTHNGGAVYNSDAAGTRLGFNELMVDLPSSSDASKSLTELTKDNFVLFTQLTKSQSGFDIAFAKAPTPADGKILVNIVEFDTVIGGTENFGASGIIGRYIIHSASGVKTSVYFKYNKDTNSIELPSPSGKIYEGAAVKTIKVGEWNNFRFEYFLDSGDLYVKFYLNNEHVTTFNGADGGTASVNKVQFYFHNATSGLWYGIDNIYVGYAEGDPLPPPPADEDIDALAGTHGGGVLYNDSTKAGKRYDFSADTQLQKMFQSNGSASNVDAKVYKEVAKYMRTDTLSHDNTNYQRGDSNATVNVAEMDIAFMNLEGINSMFISVYNGSTLGKTHKINIGLKNGVIRFGDSDTPIHQAENYTPPVEDTWYNLRFETYIVNDGAADTSIVKIYVNGEYALTVKAQLGSNTNQGRVLYQLYSTYASSGFAVDNIYLGDHGKAYTAEATPEVPDQGTEGGETTPPDEGEDTEDGGTTPEPDLAGNRGTGTYYNNQTGTKFNFTQSTSQKEFIAVPGYSALTSGLEHIGTDDKAAYYYSPSADYSQVYARFDGLNVTEALENHVMIVEQDIAFTNLGASVTNAYRFELFFGKVEGANARLGIRIGTDDNGEIKFNNTIASGNNTALEQDKWYNIRFELYADGKVKVYIDNVYTLTLSADVYNASSYTTRINYCILEPGEASHGLKLDNLYIGCESKIYTDASSDNGEA